MWEYNLMKRVFREVSYHDNGRMQMTSINEHQKENSPFTQPEGVSNTCANDDLGWKSGGKMDIVRDKIVRNVNHSSVKDALADFRLL